MAEQDINMEDIPANQPPAARGAEDLPKKRKLQAPQHAAEAKDEEAQRIANLKLLDALLEHLPFKKEFFHSLYPQTELTTLVNDQQARRKAILQHLARFPLSETTATVPLASTDWALLTCLPKSLRYTAARQDIDDEDEDSSDEESAPQAARSATPDPNKKQDAPTLEILSGDIKEANEKAKNLRLARKKFRRACRAYATANPKSKYTDFVRALNGVVCEWVTFIGNLDILLQEGINLEIPGVTWLIGHPDHRRFLNRLHSQNNATSLLPDDFVFAQNRLCSTSSFLSQSYADLYRFNIDTFEFDSEVEKEVMEAFVDLVENLKSFSSQILDTIGFSPEFTFYRVHTNKVLNDLDKRKQRQSKEILAFPPKYIQTPGRGGRPRGRGRNAGRARGGSFRGRY